MMLVGQLLVDWIEARLFWSRAAARDVYLDALEGWGADGEAFSVATTTLKGNREELENKR